MVDKTFNTLKEILPRSRIFYAICKDSKYYPISCYLAWIADATIEQNNKQKIQNELDDLNAFLRVWSITNNLEIVLMFGLQSKVHTAAIKKYIEYLESEDLLMPL